MALYLGLDSSTQSLTAVVIDTVSGGVSQPWSVNFGADLRSKSTRLNSSHSDRSRMPSSA